MASSIKDMHYPDSLSEIDTSWTVQDIALTNETDYTLQDDGYCIIYANTRSLSISSEAIIRITVKINGVQVFQNDSYFKYIDSTKEIYLGKLYAGTVINAKFIDLTGGNHLGTYGLRIIHK